MNIVLTNHGNEAQFVTNGEYVETVQPGEPLTFTAGEVYIVGDKPDTVDAIKEGLGTMVGAAKDLLSLKKPTGPEAPPTLNFTIGNNGPNSIRVILGDGVTANDVAPGVSYQAVCPRYIEIRELGLVDPNITNPQQAA